MLVDRAMGQGCGEGEDDDDVGERVEREGGGA